MADTFYIFFTKHKPVKVLSLLSISNPMNDFKFSVTRTSTGKISIRKTVKPYGYMITEEDLEKLKKAGWCGMVPTAMMRIEGKHLQQMVKMIKADGAPELNFVSSRLVSV